VSIEEMEAIDVRVPWPKPRQRPPQLDGRRVPHLCRRCLGPIERHGGDLIPKWFCCPTCSTASAEVKNLCACGTDRAGARLKCVKLAGEGGGPAEVVVLEAE
jgi:hypothetical protein